MDQRSKRRPDEVPAVNEVHLRRLTVDEALLKLDEYLDDAFMAGLYQVRVVHGKGTGTLRQAVRQRLAKHPLVKSYRPGGYGEGGAGVTVVELVPS
jgi:DNA mismatch repair protein MutS2